MTVFEPLREDPVSSPLHTVLRVLRAAIRGLALISAGLVAVGLGVVLYAVGNRYLLGQPVNWADELNGYLVIGILGCGIGAALLENRHIGLDLLTGLAGERGFRALMVWSNLSVLATAGLFTWSAWHTVRFNRDFGTYSNGSLEAPMWLMQAPLVVGGVALILAAVVRLTESAMGVKR